MALLAGLFEDWHIEWDVQLILALAWLVFGISVVAILPLMYMIREGETSRVSSAIFIWFLPGGGQEAWLLFDETLTIPGICAMVVTVLGVYLVTKNKLSSKSPQLSGTLRATNRQSGKFRDHRAAKRRGHGSECQNPPVY